MPLIAYRKYKPREDAAEVIDRANQILQISLEDGFGTMTLRQIYYQFIARNWLPENTVQQYKKLGRILADAREGGLLDWLAIEDGQRSSFHFHDCPTPQDLLDGIERGLLLNPWNDQDVYVETWVEKQGMEGTIARPCNSRRAGYMACKGYLSVSEAWRAGQRFEAQKAKGKRLVLLHLGDHDPSGIDMTRDNKDRLEFFSREHGIEVQRLALNMDQVEQYDPPPQFAKDTDSRFDGYKKLYGEHSWELDALRQSVIGKLITDALDKLIDWDKWNESMAKERELRSTSRVGELAGRWDEVHKLLMDDGFPMDRLDALDELALISDGAIDFLGHGRAGRPGAQSIVAQHDLENNRKLFDNLGWSCDEIDRALKALDEVAEKAQGVLAEREQKRRELAERAPEDDIADLEAEAANADAPDEDDED